MGVPVADALPTFDTWPPPCDPSLLLTRLAALPRVYIQRYRIDVDSFHRYLAVVPYPDSYREGFGALFVEKALEHWVSLDLLGGPIGHDVAVDVAANSSPFREIHWALTGIPTYRQDLSFPEGLSGVMIGGSAEHLPFWDGAVARMTLHCSFEHFEANADSAFIREAGRVLRPGGRLCILPLYVADVYHNITDPELDRDGLLFDDGAAIAEVRGWHNRFGRFYDVEQFQRRILAQAGDFIVTLFYVENAQDVDPACYLRFALLLTKLWTPPARR